MSELHDQELEAFEAELRKVKAAPASGSTCQSPLGSAGQRPNPRWLTASGQNPEGMPGSGFCVGWRPQPRWERCYWLLLAGIPQRPTDRSGTNFQAAQTASASLASAVRPANTDEIEIGRTLVATFDAVAELPSGEPVRFRCQEWADTTVFRDRARGIAIERSTPRLEIVPISFETY